MSNQPNKTNGAKPAVHKKKNLLDDRRIRLALSVLGAIVAWMVVTIIVQPGTTNTIYNVPVDYTYDSAAYTSRGLSIVSAEDKTVNLKLSGDGYTIGGAQRLGFCGLPGLVQRARQRRKDPSAAGARCKRPAQRRDRDHGGQRQHGGRGV